MKGSRWVNPEVGGWISRDAQSYYNAYIGDDLEFEATWTEWAANTIRWRKMVTTALGYSGLVIKKKVHFHISILHCIWLLTCNLSYRTCIKIEKKEEVLRVKLNE